MKSLKFKIIELFEKGLPYSQIQKELNCSKAIISYYCNGLLNNRKKEITNKVKLEINKLLEEGKTYKQVANLLKISTNTVSKYKLIRKNIDWKNQTSIENIKQQKDTLYYRKRRIKIKEDAVKYKGGECQKCKYSKCINALDFHHINPNEKDFNISRSYKKSWDKIKHELDKTILLCSNCHREFHSLRISVNEFLNNN